MVDSTWLLRDQYIYVAIYTTMCLACVFIWQLACLLLTTILLSKGIQWHMWQSHFATGLQTHLWDSEPIKAACLLTPVLYVCPCSTKDWKNWNSVDLDSKLLYVIYQILGFRFKFPVFKISCCGGWEWGGAVLHFRQSDVYENSSQRPLHVDAQ